MTNHLQMNQYNPLDNLSVQPATIQQIQHQTQPPNTQRPPHIPFIPLLKKHAESASLQLSCLQKCIYFSQQDLVNKTNHQSIHNLDHHMNLLDAADLLMTLTKSQILTLSAYRHFHIYTSSKDPSKKTDIFYNPWTTPTYMPPNAQH